MGDVWLVEEYDCEGSNCVAVCRHRKDALAHGYAVVLRQEAEWRETYANDPGWISHGDHDLREYEDRVVWSNYPHEGVSLRRMEVNGD